MSEGIKNITWLASYPKSGNTWVRVLLNNLTSGSIEPININQIDISSLASCRALFEFHSGVSASDLTNEEILNLRPNVYRKISASNPDNIYFKVHDAWHTTPNGDELFPSEITKGVIYIVRNPLDIAVSYAFHNAISIEESVFKLNDKNHSLSKANSRLSAQLEQKMYNWSDHVQSWIDKSLLNIHVVRYEDMILDTYSSFQNVLRFLDHQYHEEDVRRAIKNSSIEILKEQENKYGFVEKPQVAKSFFRTGNINNWDKHLNSKLKESIISSHHAIMSQFGYI